MDNHKGNPCLLAISALATPVTPAVLFAVSATAGLNDIDLTPDESGLSELLNMAYAQHEIIADTTLQMLDWFEQQPVLKASRQ